MMRITSRVSVVGALLIAASVSLAAQLVRPVAEVIPEVAGAVRAGSSVQLRLKVRLPTEVHVQSDKPRDPSLIPTQLTIDVPAGVTVEQVVYPPATDLAQAGGKAPLAVLGPEFTIGIRLSLGADLAPGTLRVPARLRYQACDEKVCYPPARAAAEWNLVIE